MASGGSGDQLKKRSKANSRLSEQAHSQVLEYLRIAEKSEHDEIRKTALELAKETSKYHHKQNARVSSTLILWVIVLLGIAVTGICSYAFLHYPEQKASQIRQITVLVYLIIVGVCLFLSGHLSQANFMKILAWLADHLRARWNAVTNKSGESNLGPD